MADKGKSSARRMFGCIGLFASLVAGLGGWVWWAYTLPPWEPAHVALPEPNAYDVYVEAIDMLHPPREDEFDLHNSAPLAVVRRVVERERPALDRFRSAFKLDCWLGYGPYVIDFEPAHIADFRRAASLHVAEARLAQAEGRWEYAAHRCLDAAELGGDSLRFWLPISGVLGDAVGVPGESRLAYVVAELSASEARTTLGRLNTIHGEWEPLESHIDRNRTVALIGFRAYLDTRVTGSPLDLRTLRQPGKWASSVVETLRGRRIRWNRIVRWYDGLLADLQAPHAVRMTIPERRHPWPTPGMRGVASPPGTHAKALRLALQWDADATRRELLRLMLALRIHKLEQGAYPDTLAPLTPLLEGELPRDPFSHQPFKYERTADGYLLWSVGPDGVDDGGSPALRWNFSGEPKGDIVAGKVHGDG